MRHIALFAGIGGDTLAAEWAGFETVLFVENDKFCQKVLNKHWPGVPIIGDIKDATKETIEEAIANTKSRGLRQGGSSGSNEIQSKNRSHKSQVSSGREFRTGAIISREPPITLITGGFPCQPVSGAGKQRGKEDDRWLWPDMLRVISEVRPTWVVPENVAGLINMGLDDCISDLESRGYEVQTFQIPACAVNAPHRRDRVFIVAYSGGNRRRGRDNGDEGRDIRSLQVERPSAGDKQGNVADTESGQSGKQEAWDRRQDTSRGSQIITDTENTHKRRSDGEVDTRGGYPEARGQSIPIGGEEYWAVEPDVGRVAHGVSSRVDRLKGLGNAIVPQQIYPILKAIADIEQGLN